MVDGLIKKVQEIRIPEAGAAGTAAKPIGNGDICWAPQIPPGHTPYSWLGEDDEEVPQKNEGKGKQGKKNEKKGQQKKQKKEKKQKQPKTAPVNNTPAYARVDLRVGHVVRVFPHPDPEVKSLWCEEIDVGEDKPRQIASGLRKFYTQDQFQDKLIVVVCNLKPAKLKKFESNGMVLCASNADHTKVELVEPPAGSTPGTRISLENLDVNQFTPDARINTKKKKNNAWLDVAAKLKTNTEKVATYGGIAMVTPEGKCTVPTLGDCILK